MITFKSKPPLDEARMVPLCQIKDMVKMKSEQFPLGQIKDMGGQNGSFMSNKRCG